MVRPKLWLVAATMVSVMAVLIDTHGKVSRVWTAREVQFKPPFPEFNEAIVAAVRQWEFEPSTPDGHTVPVCMAVTIIVDRR